MRLFGRSGVDNSGNDSDRETCKTTVKLLYWPSFQQIMVILVGHCRNTVAEIEPQKSTVLLYDRLKGRPKSYAGVMM